MTQQLSPAAQAVRNAAGWQGTSLEREAQNIAAAVLRAAADQVVPQEPPSIGGMRPGGTGAVTLDEAQMFQRSSTRRRLLAIAAELESVQ
jgi:hypothetical protein